jgi:hypothetical protein
VVLEHEGESVVVAGVTDFSSHHYDAAHRSDPAAALAGAPRQAGVRLLLAHQPRTAFVAEPAGYDLQLSVHRGLAAAGPSLGLHQPGHRILGAAETRRRAFGDHALAARVGLGRVQAGGGLHYAGRLCITDKTSC